MAVAMNRMAIVALDYPKNVHFSDLNRVLIHFRGGLPAPFLHLSFIACNTRQPSPENYEHVGSYHENLVLFEVFSRYLH